MATEEEVTLSCFDCGKPAFNIHHATGYVFCDQCARENGGGTGATGWGQVIIRLRPE